jgi:hypothetical protein
MMRQCVAVLFMTSLGVCAPVLADNFVSPRFTTSVKSSSVTVTLLSGYLESGSPRLTGSAALPKTDAAYSFQTPIQLQPEQPASPVPPHRHWAKVGKILTTVGLGLIGTGVAVMARRNQDYPTCVSRGCPLIMLALQ